MKNIMYFLNKNPVLKIIFFTPLIYPHNIGFTKWNFMNLILATSNPNDKLLYRFNANNSAAVLFGSLTFYVTNQKNFKLWLKDKKISHFSEKVGHTIPFLFYLYGNAFDKQHYLSSILSLSYQLVWSSLSGKHIFIKDDIYYKAKYRITWYLCWIFIFYGHFFVYDTKKLKKFIKKHYLLHTIKQNPSKCS